MKDIGSLFILITSFNDEEFEDFKRSLSAIVQRLSSILMDHLAYEDKILWPVSLIVIDDIKIWKLIKEICEELGYCGSHL